MKRSITLLLGFLIAISAILTSCSNDDDGAPQDPPTLPPASSMIIDFGNFPQNGSGRVDQTQNNYGFAALNVLFWQSLLTVQLAIPVASFYEAFNHDLTYLSDEEKWMSEYTVQAGGQSITATLYASLIEDGEKVLWEMYLSSGTFEDFLWFTGESKTDNTGGEWVLYLSPQNPRELLNIEWVRDGEVLTSSTYMLVDTESDNEGSSIEYGVTEEAGFTHYYNVSILSETEADYDVSIYFNEETKVGRVKSMAHFQDETWHCWDENLEDVDCE